MDEYLKQLSEVCGKLEDVYGLGETIDGKRIGDLDIKELTRVLNPMIAEADKEALDDLHSRAFNYMSIVCQLSDRMNYFGYVLLEYKNFPSKDVLLKILPLFLKKSSITFESRLEVNNLIGILDVIDNKHLKIRYDLAYRYLRLFVLFIMFSNFASSSSISRLILHQIEGSG